ncbi:MAG TPA: hypothetical protein VFV64_11795, partial [Permianibacter sp.]|nr:hypothetical protein [Permianibacter sp.]
FSTVIMVLLVLIGGFYMVPDPTSGMTVISSQDRRVQYNAIAVALGGASLATLLISLAGFYLTSNSLTRDVRTRMGAIMAATPVSNSALLLGKWLGNAGYLGCIVLALIPGGMLVQSLRAEAPIVLTDYLSVYALIFLPQILFVSAVSLWFETERWLRGRLGDVLYFFLWVGFLSLTINVGEDMAMTSWQAMLDVTAMGFVIWQLTLAFGTSSLSIGASTFDASLAPVILPGIDWSMAWLRALALIPALLVFSLAVLRFHRYNPDRVKAEAAVGGQAWWQGFNRRLAFLSALLRPLWRLLPLLPAPVRRVMADVLMTFVATPVWLLMLAIGYLIAVLTPTDSLGMSLVFCLSAGALACADIGLRDEQSGMWRVLATAPGLQERFLRWKWFSALTTLLLFVAVTVIRMLLHAPAQALMVLVGVVLCASMALVFALLAHSAKLFAGAYLFLLYLSINAKGEPAFDFAGINGVATAASMTGYLLAAVLALSLVWLTRRAQSN